MKHVPHLFLLCLFAFLGRENACAQKAKNLVFNGDLELVPDTMFWYDRYNREYNPFQSYLLGAKLNNTVMNDSLNGSKHGLYLISKDQNRFSLGIGKIQSPNSQSSTWDFVLNDFPLNRVGAKAVKFYTGRTAYSLYVGKPEDTYSSWGSSILTFPIKDSILINEKLYVEWMDLRFKFSNTSEFGLFGSGSRFCDSIPDTIQIGLSYHHDDEGAIIFKGLASIYHWEKHGFVFYSPVTARYITIGNKGDPNNITGYIPCPSCPTTPWTVGDILTGANYFDNLRLFRVASTSKRDTMLCGPGPFILPGKAGKEWAWNDSLFTKNISINLGDSGWYVNKTFTDGFVQIDSVYVRFDKAYSPQPVTDTTGCTGQALQLNSPRSGGFTYLWSDNSNNANISINMPGSYWVQSKKGNCTLIDTFRVQFAPKPLVYIGADTAFCGSFVHLLNAGPGRKEYTWNTGDKTSTLSVNTPGKYSVTIKDSLNCPNADTIQLDKIFLNPITITEDTFTCKYVTLTGSPQQNNVTYSWSNGATGISTQVNQTGTYTLTATHPYCSISQSIDVSGLPQAPKVNLGPDTTLCGYNNIVLQNKENNLPNYTYQWNTGEHSEKILISDSGTYTLTVYRNQCKNSDTIEVAPNCEGTYYVPTAFSPNGDGLNETFQVTGNNIQYVSMRIYSRWGEEVYYGEGKEVSWDGTFKHTTCSADVYAYSIVVTAKNKEGLRHQLSGTVTLLR